MLVCVSVRAYVRMCVWVCDVKLVLTKFVTLNMRKYSFSQRVINEWNKLPNDCVNASSVNMFKNRIDRHLIRAGYT